MNNALTDAARTFIQELSSASNEQLEQTFGVLAGAANNSPYAAELEPYHSLVDALFAEQRRRAFKASSEAVYYDTED